MIVRIMSKKIEARSRKHPICRIPSQKAIRLLLQNLPPPKDLLAKTNKRPPPHRNPLLNQTNEEKKRVRPFFPCNMPEKTHQHTDSRIGTPLNIEYNQVFPSPISIPVNAVTTDLIGVSDFTNDRARPRYHPSSTCPPDPQSQPGHRRARSSSPMRQNLPHPWRGRCSEYVEPRHR